MVDEDTFEFTKRFNLSAVPTLLIFKDGVMVNSLLGFVPKTVLRTFIEESMKF
jgi:thioredoxin-like negative regulator of GroEL